MTCLSCLEKAYRRYRAHNLDHEHALYMAKKLIARLEKRQRKERIRYFYKYVNQWLFKWIFLCNWQATLYNRRWVGKGYNPDYTLLCVTSGSVTCVSVTCTASLPDCLGTCTTNFTCACACSAPLADSHYVSDTCISSHATCRCRLISSLCRCSVTAPTCSCAGTCAYECDVGFSWNGVACVAPSNIVNVSSKPYISLLGILYAVIVNAKRKEKKKKYVTVQEIL